MTPGRKFSSHNCSDRDEANDSSGSAHKWRMPHILPASTSNHSHTNRPCEVVILPAAFPIELASRLAPERGAL